eukprot:evm.model.scf_340.2 EVM.evm.TU.scf_340.2   scf_340:10284-14045(+)
MATALGPGGACGAKALVRAAAQVPRELGPSRRRGSSRCSAAAEEGQGTDRKGPDRRQAFFQLAGLAAGVATLVNASEALAVGSPKIGFKKDLKKKRVLKIPDSEYQNGPEGLKYVDLKVGAGPVAKVGERVAIHFDCRWKNITFMTSRQGMGVTGGTPFGFDVGAKSGTAGSTLKGLDLGVRGMHVGGLRRLKVPPELAYGNKAVGEIPPGATLDIDVELLSIKTNPFGA